MSQEIKQDLKNHIRKTGTTTVAIVCKDGIVLAADKRGTYGGEGGVSYIAGKEEEKILKVTDNILVTIAGNASDIQKVVKLTRAELRLKELRTKQPTSIKEAANLFSNLVYQNIRQFSVILAVTHFLLAGYDEKGFYLYEVHPDGYLHEVKNYSATGSGFLHVNPILDADYKDSLTVEEGIKLAKKCVNAALKRDPASGEGIDIYTVTKDNVKQVAKQELVQEFKDR